MVYEDYKVKHSKGCILNGHSWSGKTTKLGKMWERQKTHLFFLSLTKQLRMLKQGWPTTFMKREMQTKYISLLIVICEWKGRDLNSLEDKTIFIEEFSMVQNKWMTLIYKALTMFNNKTFMFEDPNQCEPVESNSQRRYNFLESKTVNEMCPKRKNLEYIESGCRYDIKIHEMSDKFLKTGQISTYFSYKYYKNLCYLHSTRIKDNTGCCDRFVKNKKEQESRFKIQWYICKN